MSTEMKKVVSDLNDLENNCFYKSLQDENYEVEWMRISLAIGEAKKVAEEMSLPRWLPKRFSWPRRKKGRFCHKAVYNVIVQMQVGDWMVARNNYERRCFSETMLAIRGKKSSWTRPLRSKEQFMCKRIR